MQSTAHTCRSSAKGYTGVGWGGVGLGWVVLGAVPQDFLSCPPSSPKKYNSRSSVVIVSVASDCMSVCNTITFESLDVESAFLVCGYIFRGYSFKFVEVNVTAGKTRNSIFSRCQTSIGNNPGSIEGLAASVGKRCRIQSQIARVAADFVTLLTTLRVDILPLFFQYSSSFRAGAFGLVHAQYFQIQHELCLPGRGAVATERGSYDAGGRTRASVPSTAAAAVNDAAAADDDDDDGTSMCRR